MILTVFTPTYNRENLLPRVYESLKAQTNQSFKWLVVDDGSTDGTRQLISDYIKQQAAGDGFKVSYHYQQNAGKMNAHNTGVKLCDTELFLCLDSDDELSPDAVESILCAWSDGDYAGIVAYKGERELATGKVKPFRDALFPNKILEQGSSTLRGIYRAGFYGETTLVFRTELLKRFLFPEIPGEKYVPEDYVYDKIDAVCPLVVLPKILTVCELIEGGYTDQVKKLRDNNPTGWYLYYEQRMQIEPWSMLKIKYISHYLRFSEVLGKKAQIPFIWKAVALPGAMILKFKNKT